VSFKEGDVVVIANPSTLYTMQFLGKRGAITGILPNETFPFEVTFPGGNSLSFSEVEISTVEDGGQEDDDVNHPSHYTWLPNGLEVIDVTENLNFNLGNAVKYVLRANHKHDQPLTDLRKAVWYITREIQRMEAAQ
jgi:hypothetical protein